MNLIQLVAWIAGLVLLVISVSIAVSVFSLKDDNS